MKKMNRKSKQRTLAGVALIVVVLLVASGIFVYYEYFEEEETIIEDTTIVVDDQISPLENQGLILEVLRIRHRGCFDKLMTRGRSWKEKPRFYYVASLDDIEYSSREVRLMGRVTPTYYVGWDTMFQENKLSRDTEEEQEISTITLKLFEVVQVRSGLFRTTNKDIEREKITVTYDYRTGRWSGDDNFKDYDGYGHYRGTYFEIWFNIYQNDFDRDYIPYWTEVNVLNTDPYRDDSDKDPDMDGIPTTWEWKWGYDPFTWDDHEKLDPDIDGVENIEEYQCAKWFADPYHQDIYCEVDHMGGTGIFDPPHILWEETQQAIIEKYAEHNINMYFDTGWPDTPKNGGGDVLPHYQSISQDSGMILRFYNHYFPDDRKGVFRYIIMAHGGAFNHPAVGNVYDVIVSGSDLSPRKVLKRFIKGMWHPLPTGRGLRIWMGSILMHELGHSVGIVPWSFEGCDNVSYIRGQAAEAQYAKTWGQYWSVMNYYNQFSNDLLDYSDGSNGPPYDQNDWEKLFVACFQYNEELVEEIYFEPPGLDKVVWGETEIGVTGYEYDEELTEKLVKRIGDWSPVKPIKANWMVFKLKQKDKFPEFKEIKILVQPKDVPFAKWAEYAEGELDSDGKIQVYSQQAIIDELYLQLEP